MADKKSSRRGDLTPDDLRRSGPNRRREPRFSCEKEVAVLPCRATEGWGFFTTRMFDCSQHGIGILSERQIPQGDQFMVRLGLDVTRLVIYSVCYCVPMSGGGYKIGAELIRVVGMDAGHPTEEFLRRSLSKDSTRPD